MIIPEQRKPHPDPHKETILSFLLNNNNSIDTGPSLWWTGNPAEFRLDDDCESIWHEMKTAPADWSIVLSHYLEKSQWQPHETQERPGYVLMQEACAECNLFAWGRHAAWAFAREHNSSSPVSWQESESYNLMPGGWRWVSHNGKTNRPSKIGASGIFMVGDPWQPIRLYRYENGRTRFLKEVSFSAKVLASTFSKDGSLFAALLENDLLVLIGLDDLVEHEIALSSRAYKLDESREDGLVYLPNIPSRLRGAPLVFEFVDATRELAVIGTAYSQRVDTVNHCVVQTMSLPAEPQLACLSQNQSSCFLVCNEWQANQLRRVLYLMPLESSGTLGTEPNLRFVSEIDEHVLWSNADQRFMRASGENVFIFTDRNSMRVSVSDGSQTVLECPPINSIYGANPRGDLLLASSPDSLGNLLLCNLSEGTFNEVPVPQPLKTNDHRLSGMYRTFGFHSNDCLFSVDDTNAFVLPLSEPAEYLDLLVELGRLIRTSPVEYRPENLDLLNRLNNWTHAPLIVRSWLKVLLLKMEAIKANG